ncbi:endo alpha-1,4 polygalactosaminidase [Gracilimonas mengyeensis]|uniref:Extracellular protein n=1 Tax=Gracilimonas mengyeensis TaxID=1302730 RepID=A0A521AIG1_9BACT|nr:endo alpha-1,4 polygalactosaminidase [Gracilimonas mengyeensis]SMO34567.1 extracellular protein [Gracilimonas mengyeensis]
MAISLMQCSTSEKAGFQPELHTPYAVCYAQVSPSQVHAYSLVILEPDFYSEEEIQELKSGDTQIIAYLTLGEVDENRWYYSLLQEQGFLGKNPNWNSAFINLENTQSRNVLLQQVLPKIMAKGVDGLFLDTIDAVAPVTERAHLQPYMAQLIKDIHEEYPQKIIIQNSGIFMLEETRYAIDAFMTESLASDYDFSSGEYLVRSDEDYHNRLEYLRFYSDKYEVPFFILDFADTPAKRDRIYQRLDSLNRPFFISNIGLSDLPEDPGGYANSLKEEDHGL